MKMDKFIVKVELGNEAMKSAKDVARLLRVLAVALDEGGLNFKYADVIKLRDVNGNTVGTAETSNVY